MGEGFKLNCAGSSPGALLFPAPLPGESMDKYGFLYKNSDIKAETVRPAASCEDEEYMLTAIELAEKGRGSVSPNPLVGAVIVKDGHMIGSGYHEYVGGPHAEVNALADVVGAAAGATMYVTLEPCNHHGRTPPCTESIVESGIERVVVSLTDPNTAVCGGGVDVLRKAGISVEVGLFSEITKRQNEAYLKLAVEGCPFITLKMASTLDGKIATSSGLSQWISSGESRMEVHALRAFSDAVLVGIGTVLSDNPRLTSRDVDVDFDSPLRVVADSMARTPIESNVVRDGEAGTLIAVSGEAPDDRVQALRDEKVEVIRFGEGNKVDLKLLLKSLGDRGLSSVLCEGGGKIAFSLLEGGLVDKIIFYIAPKIIGGDRAPGPVGGAGFKDLDDAFRLQIDSVSYCGPDLRIIAYPGGER